MSQIVLLGCGSGGLQASPVLLRQLRQDFWALPTSSSSPVAAQSWSRNSPARASAEQAGDFTWSFLPRSVLPPAASTNAPAMLNCLETADYWRHISLQTCKTQRGDSTERKSCRARALPVLCPWRGHVRVQLALGAQHFGSARLCLSAFLLPLVPSSLFHLLLPVTCSLSSSHSEPRSVKGQSLWVTRTRTMVRVPAA